MKTFNAVHRKVRLSEIVGKGEWCRQISSLYESECVDSEVVGKHDGVMQFRVYLFEVAKGNS